MENLKQQIQSQEFLFTYHTLKTFKEDQSALPKIYYQYINNQNFHHPDLYYGCHIIKSSNYTQIQKADEENQSTEEKTSHQDCKDQREILDNENTDDEKEDMDITGIYENLKRQRLRYFNCYDNIAKMCSKCGKPGHYGIICRNQVQFSFCLSCGKKDHYERKCPLRKMCFKCRKRGHYKSECTEKIERRCYNCGTNGHHYLDCLIKPEMFGSYAKGFLCKFPNDAAFYIDHDEYLDKLQGKSDISTICPMCTENHRLRECPFKMGKK